MPRFLVFRKSKTRVRVTNSKPFRNPYHEILFVTPSRNGSRSPGLFERPFRSDLPRALRLASYADPEAKRFSLGFPSFIAPFNPPERRATSLYREAILLTLECAPVCPGSQKNANFTRRLQSKSDMKRQKTSEATMSWFESMRGSHLNGNTLCIQRLPKDILVCHLLAMFWAKGCESTRVIPIGGEQLNPGARRSKNLPKGRFLNRTAVHLELLKALPPRARSRRPVATNTTRLFSPACRTTAVPSPPSKRETRLSPPLMRSAMHTPNQGPGF